MAIKHEPEKIVSRQESGPTVRQAEASAIARLWGLRPLWRLNMNIIDDIGPLPEPDMSHEKARDDRDEEVSYSHEAMETERRRCYLLGLSRGWHNGVSTNPGDQAMKKDQGKGKKGGGKKKC